MPPTQRVTSGLRYSPLAALVAILLYTPAADSFWAGVELFAVGAIVFGAAFGVGAIIGFLFGIPRRIQREGVETAAGAGLSVNTNLEQISDWLTKIIVGVGLVEIGSIAGGLNSVAEGIELSTSANAKTFALALIVYSLVDGFLLAYVWTRVELSAQLNLADRQLEPPALPPPPLPPPPPPPAGPVP
jgi:hypothetical protein